MKKETYTLTLEYRNGDMSRRGGLTQSKAYEILKRAQARGWITSQSEYGEDIVRWKIDTGWKEIKF